MENQGREKSGQKWGGKSENFLQKNLITFGSRITYTHQLAPERTSHKVQRQPEVLSLSISVRFFANWCQTVVKDFFCIFLFEYFGRVFSQVSPNGFDFRLYFSLFSYFFSFFSSGQRSAPLGSSTHIPHREFLVPSNVQRHPEKGKSAPGAGGVCCMYSSTLKLNN